MDSVAPASTDAAYTLSDAPKALQPNASRARAAGTAPDSPSAPPDPTPSSDCSRGPGAEFDPARPGLGHPAANAAAPATQAALATSPVTTRVGWVTGPGTVTPAQFGIYGTDVGIMWDNGMTGDNRQVLTIFGDTFSGPNMSGVWRSNVLLRTTDPIARTSPPGSITNPFSGSPLSGPGMSKQMIKPKDRVIRFCSAPR